MRNVKKILLVLALIMLIAPSIETHAATFNIKGVGEFDSEEVFVSDFDVFCLPGEEEESPGGFINRVKTLGSSYWKAGGNYFLFIEWNRSYYVRGTWYEFEDCPDESLPYLCIRNNFGDMDFVLMTRNNYLSPLVSSGYLTSHHYFDAEGGNAQLENGSFGECTSWELLTSSAFDVSYQYDVFSISGDFRIITNIPFFLDDAAIQAYKDTGDASGAVNAGQIEDITTEPAANNSYTNKSLKLNNLTYHGQYLNLRPFEKAYMTFQYSPSYEGYSLDDMYLDVLYQYDASFKVGGLSTEELTDKTLYGTVSYKLSDVSSEINLNPTVMIESAGSKFDSMAYVFGGSASASSFGVDISGLEVGPKSILSLSNSLLKISLRLRATKNGDNDCSSMAYTQVVNLLTGDCDFYYSNADEEGNYTQDEESYKTADNDGNVTINNNVSGGGGSGGGSSSASGGNATATVGNITNTNIFKFPDKIDINLNVKDIDIDLDITQKKGFWENLLETGNLVLNYIKTFIEEKSEVTGKLFDTGGKVLDIIDNVLEETKDEVVDTADKTLTTITGLPALVETLTTGFTLFSQEDGLIGLYRDTLDMFPSTFWTLVYASISVGIIHLVLHYKK